MIIEKVKEGRVEAFDSCELEATGIDSQGINWHKARGNNRVDTQAEFDCFLGLTEEEIKIIARGEMPTDQVLAENLDKAVGMLRRIDKLFDKAGSGHDDELASEIWRFVRRPDMDGFGK